MYEYKVVDRHFANRGVTEHDLLNEHGREGWQLTAVVMFGSYVRYYFARRNG